MSNAVGSRVNPLEVLYPMLQPSRFFARVLGFGFSPEARRALFLTEYVEGKRIRASGILTTHCPVPTPRELAALTRFLM